MIGTTAAVLGAAAIGGAASLASGVMGASAANKAANAQAASADKSLALQAAMYEQGRQDNMPWMEAGKTALAQYMGELGMTAPASVSKPSGSVDANGFDAAYYLKANPDVAASAKYGSNPYGHYQDWGKAEGRSIADPNASAAPATPFKSGFKETPGYQFQVQEGEKGVVNNMAALGMKNSGAALKALTRFRTGLADQTYNTYLDRLSGMAGAGAATTSNQAQLGASSAANQGQTITDAGAARASGYVGGANAWQNALGSFSNTAGNALGWAA